MLREVARSDRPARLLTMETVIQECLILRTQGRLEGALYPGRLTTGCIFGLQVDGPITGGAYKRGGGGLRAAVYIMPNRFVRLKEAFSFPELRDYRCPNRSSGLRVRGYSKSKSQLDPECGMSRTARNVGKCKTHVLQLNPLVSDVPESTGS